MIKRIKKSHTIGAQFYEQLKLLRVCHFCERLMKFPQVHGSVDRPSIPAEESYPAEG